MPQPRKPRGSRGRQPQGPQADVEGRRFARQTQQDVIEGTKFQATPTPRATAPGAIDESTSYYPNEPPVAPQPPKGRGGGPAWGQTPFGGYEVEPGLSPEEAKALEISVDKGVLARIRSAQGIAPSVRQQTRAELINLALLYERLGNPFSIRRIPFSVLRDMTTDPMIGFALFNTVVPLIRADWYIESPDAQLAAAVDAALRPIHSYITQQMCGKLSYGYAPIVKQFRLGKLEAFYRDPNGEDTEKDLPVWDSDVDMLLWREFQNLAPEHCLPRWNERGDFDGYYFSIVPLPNPIQIGLANLYGYAVVPGYEVTTEFAMWSVNERAPNFGSIYGSPRIKRAYRYYWSYWYRWALADRAFENLADPPKWIYYPTDVPQGLDPEDPNFATGNETTTHFRTLALQILDQMRSGTGVAFPGDFMIDEVSGKMSGTRKWEAGYYKPDVHFDDLAKSFSMLDALKFRACFIPENAFIEGSHSTTSGGSGGTSRLMGVQLGEVWRESQQLLADENDEDISRDMIPQFIAVNYPEKVGVPCRKVTRGMGQIDTEIVKQLIQLVGQVKGEILPVDIYELFRREGIPLLTEKQQKQEMEQIAKEAEAMQPAPMQPPKTGMQGYNAGIERTSTGMTRYVQPQQRIDLATSGQGFLAELPEVPAYGDAAVRASMMRMRKLMLERYKEQIESFCKMLEAQPALHLAQQSRPQQTSQGPSTPQVPSNVQVTPSTIAAGLTPANAAGVASSIVGAWQTGRGADVAGLAIAGILLAIAVRAARKELKKARLSVDDLDETQLDEYARRRASFVMQSIDDTVRGEMQTFLGSELQQATDPARVARDARTRFAETPETHAERVVMAETLPAYNQGMLLGLMDAGVEQFMAHDASDGTNQLTDKICIQRNGQAMSAKQALEAVATMHPYCTLYFTALSTDNFSIELVEKIPESLNGDPTMLASYDSEHEILYIREEASEEERREFALAIGGMLALK